MFHKEGSQIIITSFILFAVIAVLAEYKISLEWLRMIVQATMVILLILILQFFRNPKRITPIDDKHLIAPVDGKVVIVKEVFEKEYFKDMRLQISIFMSPLNVHVTRYTMSGFVKFSKYHPGKYLVAWHPKSSELNERTSVVIENDKFGEILYRQIAGAVARRIVNYAEIGKRLCKEKMLGSLNSDLE